MSKMVLQKGAPEEEEGEEEEDAADDGTSHDGRREGPKSGEDAGGDP